MGTVNPPPYVVVVSLQKSGTNLVARMMADCFGYHCVGHGIRESFDEIQARLHAKDAGTSDKRSLFSQPGLMLDMLQEYPPQTCMFLHGLEVGSHLLDWCSTGKPRILFNYRDPRDSLLSLVNYLLQRANHPYSPFARNVIYAQILESMPNASAQLDFAIEHMGEHVEKYKRNNWLLFHPSVAKVSFEQLVGADGGGTDCRQRATVRRVGDFLGSVPRDQDLRLFDPSARTFFRGQVGAWRGVFSAEQTRTFGRLYGDVLRTYGYPGALVRETLQVGSASDSRSCHPTMATQGGAAMIPTIAPKAIHTDNQRRGVDFMMRRANDFEPMNNCLVDAEYSELPGYRRNKVRDSYKLSDRRRLLISTDRQSAFDHVLAAVPYKGQVLTQTARYWFDKTADVCPNHVISYPDPNVVMVKDLDMLPIEIVVRSYLTGSTNTSPWPMYDRGERVLYGHEFPDELKKNQRLARPIITPTTKPAQGGHDAPITESEILQTQLVTTEQWHELAKRSLALFARGQELAAEKGLILVDTKYEFGLDEDGMIVVADEIHTPDSSRFWIADTYQGRFEAGDEPDSLDKEFLRLWIVSQCDPYRDPIPDIPAETLIEFSNKYIDLFERLTGLEFEKPDPSISVRARIHDALAKELPEYF